MTPVNDFFVTEKDFGFTFQIPVDGNLKWNCSAEIAGTLGTPGYWKDILLLSLH